MSEKLRQLAERRNRLIEQAASQRAALSQAAQPWRTTLEHADTGLAALRYVKTHPGWLAAGGAILMAVLGPARVLRWLGRGWLGLQMVNQLRNK